MIESVGDWLKLVMVAGFVGGGLTFLLPDDRSRLKDYLRLAVSLLLLLILLTPIIKAATGKSELPFPEQNEDEAPPAHESLYEKTLLREADKLFRARLEAIIQNKFPESTATAVPIYNTADEEVTLKCIRLYCHGDQGEDIARHLRSLLETEVILCE